MNTVDIYVLRCPLTNEIRYAGKANNSKARLEGHLRDCSRKSTPSACWVFSLVEKGLAPIMEVVEVVHADAWEDAERALIAKLRADPAIRLLNLADGGRGASKTPEQMRASGPRATMLRQSTPQAKRIWEIKRSLGQYVKTGAKTKKYYEIIGKMKLAAAKNPKMFAKWALL